MAIEDDVYEAELQIRDGIRMAYSGRGSEAVATLSSALEVAPEQPFGHLHLALALAGDGRCDEARLHAEKALAMGPERPAFHLFAGRVYFDGCDFSAAEAAFGRALELNPGNDLARGYQILAQWAGGDSRAALKLQPSALPDSSPFLARVLYMVESELRGRAVVDENPNASPRFLDSLRIGYWLWRAAGLRKAGDYMEAAALSDMVMEVCPGHAAAARFQRECRQSALDVGKRRVEEEPDSLDVRLEMAMLFADAEDYDAAAAEMGEAERISGAVSDDAANEEMKGKVLESPGVLRLRCRIAYGLGDLEEALRLARAGEEPGFSMVETWYMMGLCYAAQGERLRSFEMFECLVKKLCWAVSLRLREYRAWRRSGCRPARLCASDT